MSCETPDTHTDRLSWGFKGCIGARDGVLWIRVVLSCEDLSARMDILGGGGVMYCDSNCIPGVCKFRDHIHGDSSRFK